MYGCRFAWLYGVLSVAVGCASSSGPAGAPAPAVLVEPSSTSAAPVASDMTAAAPAPPERRLPQIVRRWFDALMRADVPGSLAYSGTPFSFDRRLIDDRADLRFAYDEVAQRKGARAIAIDSLSRTELPDSMQERAYVGADDVVTFVIAVEDERIFVFVRPRDGRVVGFRD